MSFLDLKQPRSLVKQLTYRLILLSVMSVLGVVSTFIVSGLLIAQRIEWTLEQISQQSINTLQLFFGQLTEDILRSRYLPSPTTQAEQEQLLRQIRQRNPAILDIWLVNSQGQVLAQSSRSFRPKLSYIEDQPWRSALASVKEVWFGHLERDYYTYSVMIGVKVADEFGLPYRDLKLVTRVELGGLSYKLLDIEAQETNIYITDGDEHQAKIIIHRDIRLLNTQINYSQSINQIKERLNLERGIKGDYILAYRQPFVPVAVNPELTLVSALNWVVTLEQPLNAIISGLLPFLMVICVIFGIAGWIILSILYFVRKRIIVPLNYLSQAVADLSQLQWQPSLRVESQDELGILTQAFNQMAQQLKSDFEALEIRVEERTSELKRAKEVAERANQAKREFLSKINHELRTPLSLILGYSQQLNQDFSLNQKQKEQLEIINRNGAYLLSLINNILDISKIEAGTISFEPYPFDLQQLLTDLNCLFQKKAQEKQINLKIETIPAKIRYIEGDENKIRQILINLIGNSLKFTRKGEVWLKIQLNAENQLVITVKDTGVGIAPSEMSQLFLPFQQTSSGRETQQGTGLGLYITHQLVEIMGGKIDVESQKEKGTTFTLFIPVSLSNEHDNSTFKVSSTLNLVNETPLNYRILVVDDHRESRQLLSNLISSHGFSVNIAENGQQALEIAQRFHPHLIWMDLSMPIMDGYQATQAIKATVSEPVPYIIALTADASEDRRKIALESGFDDFMTKPFLETVILQKIAYFVNRIPFSSSLTVKAIAQLPQEWLGELHQAAREFKGKAVMSLIEQIVNTYPQVYQPYKNLTQFLCNRYFLTAYCLLVYISFSMTSPIIFLVDDSPETLKLLSALLERENYDVRQSTNGKVALQGIETTLPDLILLDINLPEINGHTLCQKLKENPKTQDIPIIFISGIDDPIDKVKAFSIGGSDYITKPFELLELLARIKNQIKIRNLQKELEERNKQLNLTIKNLKTVNQKLSRLSRIDALTQIGNRLEFDEYLEQEWERAKRERQYLGLILIDIDFFKQYNDHYGHLSGDHCLYQVAQSLKNRGLRQTDRVTRYGGEEFALILPNTNIQQALIIAQSLKRAIDALKLPHLYSQVSSWVTLSLGISSLIPTATNSPEILIQQADQALYQAKSQGRNQIVSFQTTD